MRFKKSREIAARAKRRRRRRRVCDAPAKSYPRINKKLVPLSLQSRTLPSSPPYRRFCTSRISLSRVGLYRTPVCSRRGGPLQNSSFICVCVCTSYPKTTSDDKRKHTRVSLERIYESPSFLFRYACALCVCIYIKSRARESSSSRLCLFLFFLTEARGERQLFKIFFCFLLLFDALCGAVDGETARVERRSSCFLPPLFFSIATHFGTQKTKRYTDLI